jgi:hypothetical protein
MDKITRENTTDESIIPSVEEAGVIAAKIVSQVIPKFSPREQKFFITGFKECAKYLNDKLKENTINKAS